MTEQNTSGAVVALPSIGDSAVLAEILMYTGRDAIAVMLNEQGDPNDFSRIVFGVASIFMGHTDSLELPEGWDPAARGAALRPLLSDMLENMPEEDRRTFADDESLLVLAVMTCFQEAAAIAWHMPFDDDQYHRLLSAAGLSKSWTRTMQKRRLSGKIEDFSRRLWGK